MHCTQELHAYLINIFRLVGHLPLLFRKYTNTSHIKYGRVQTTKLCLYLDRGDNTIEGCSIVVFWHWFSLIWVQLFPIDWKSSCSSYRITTTSLLSANYAGGDNNVRKVYADKNTKYWHDLTYILSKQYKFKLIESAGLTKVKYLNSQCQLRIRSLFYWLCHHQSMSSECRLSPWVPMVTCWDSDFKFHRFKDIRVKPPPAGLAWLVLPAHRCRRLTVNDNDTKLQTLTFQQVKERDEKLEYIKFWNLILQYQISDSCFLWYANDKIFSDTSSRN